MRNVLNVILAAVLLTACGGGGGGGGGGGSDGLTVTPSEVTFTATAGGSAPTSQDLEVSWTVPGVGYVILGYEPGHPFPPWFYPPTYSGSGDSRTVHLTVSSPGASGLSPATYTTTLRIVLTDPGQTTLLGLRDVLVTYRVTAP